MRKLITNDDFTRSGEDLCLPFARLFAAMRATGKALLASGTILVMIGLTSACATFAEARPRAVGSYVQITTLELYTPGAVAALGSVAAVEDLIRARVAQRNRTLAASGLGNIQVVAVRMEMLDFGGLTDCQLLFAAVSDSRARALRDQYAADFVGIVQEGASGCASQGGPASGQVAAFFVVPAEGSAHLDLHEFAHPLGVFDQFVTTEWARGNCRHGEEPRFRDVMADCSEGWIPGVSTFPPVILQYSNPDVYYLGVPTGDEQHNAAAMIRTMAPIVAAYR